MPFFRNALWNAVLLVLLAQLAGPSPAVAYDPPALYLSWQRDPTTTMTVQWHTVREAPSQLFYRALGDSAWTPGTGTSAPLPSTKRHVHTVEIADLRPGTDYEFCFAKSSVVFKFRTAPADLDRPVRFITGGDVYHERGWMDNMNELAGKFDPLFVLLGGDLAYSCGKLETPEDMGRWEEYFTSWKEKARTSDGRLVPMLVTIGNHEVRGSWHQQPDKAVSFYTLFAMPGKRGYDVLDFANYLSVFLLNSAMTAPIEGAQAHWLRETLSARSKVPHLFPVYHVPAFPSYRSDTEGDSGKITQAIRKHWVPLFEQHGVKFSFENHDHTFKRTHPILAQKVDPNGVVYLGDGCWSVNVRVPDPKKPRWYIQKSGPIRHFWMVTVTRESRYAVAVNERGEFFDEVYQTVK